MHPNTLVDKIWDDHVVRAETTGTPAVLYVDLHLVHEVTSPQAFAELRRRGASVRRPELTVATMDHSTPTTPRTQGRLQVLDPQAAAQLKQLETNCGEFGIRLFGLDDTRQGIVHVIGPEQGLTQPGMTIVCGDSHTSTHGAFGALAFGIGTSEVGYVLATQTLLQRKPRNMQVRIDGTLPRGVTAKDIILAIIAKIGIGGATGHVLEYTGSAIRSLGMENRMTICNMSIEAGARAGLIAPDDTTAEYIAGRPFAPAGADWDAAVERWRQLASDEGATYDRAVDLRADDLAPMITFGTNPSMAIPIDGRVPDPDAAQTGAERADLDKALRYMALEPGQPLLGRAVDVVFVGSCTNSRISDLREAAGVMRGRQVAPGVRMLVVPGSRNVKSQAEAEGLDRVFKEAGAEWREAGCSMCIAMNGDQLLPGESAVSTSNRNFEGRQGKGGRTFLASPPHRCGNCSDGRHRRRAESSVTATTMEPFTTLISSCVVLRAENVDTDQIIPARFLKTIDRHGLGTHLFADWRVDERGEPRSDFPLNSVNARDALILLAGHNFGCGSSREHAPWALLDFGFRAIISTGFADIFRNNALKTGLLPVTLAEGAHASLLEQLSKSPDALVTIDLAIQTATLPDGSSHQFPVDPFARHCLLNGVDELGFLLSEEAAIAAYESSHAARISTR